MFPIYMKTVQYLWKSRPVLKKKTQKPMKIKERNIENKKNLNKINKKENKNDANSEN